MRLVGTLILLLVTWGPLAALVGHSVATGEVGGLDLCVPTGRRLNLLVTSVALSAAVAVTCVLVGALAATAMWGAGSGRLGRLRWAVLALVAIPPYIHASAWLSAAEGLRPALEALELMDLPQRGWTAAWWTETMAFLPVAVGLALIGLEGIDPKLMDAARCQAGDVMALRRVALPLALPSLGAAGGVVFVLSLIDYSVPSLFQVPVYALDLFAAFSADGDPGRVLMLAVPLVAICGAATWACCGTLREAALRRRPGGTVWAAPPRWPVWLRSVQLAALAALAAEVLVPLGALAAHAGGLDTVGEAVTASWDELRYTAVVSALAAVLCLGPALVAACRLEGSRVWWAIVAGPLAIPPPLVGVGLIVLWNRPLLAWVNQGPVLPVLAALARFTPVAALVLFAQRRRLDPALFEAAAVLHTSWLRTWRRIHAPLLGPGLLAAAAAALALTAGELGATLLVTPPGSSTVVLRIYNYLHYGAADTVAALCLALLGMALVCGGVAAALLRASARLQGGGA